MGNFFHRQSFNPLIISTLSPTKKNDFGDKQITEGQMTNP